MFRDRATAQISQTDESGAAGSAYTNSNPGYRAVPRITKDDDGIYGGNVIHVDRTTWGSTACGTSQSTIAARIADCASVLGATATWNGPTQGNAGQGVWKLVTRTGGPSGTGQNIVGREVWQDQRTGLLWSSTVSLGMNWCKASGSNYISGNPTSEDDPNNFCDSATYQNLSGQAVSACFEDDGTHFTQTDAAIDNGGKAGLGRASTPAVSWRLPTASDYMTALVNGMRFVLPDMSYNSRWDWTALVVTDSFGNRNQAYFVFGSNGVVSSNSRSNNRSVRCVGR